MKKAKIVYVWASVAVAIAVAVGCGAWASIRNDTPVGARTVSEFVGGGVKQENDQPGASSTQIQVDRVLSLAASLGIPLYSAPRGIVEEDTRQERSREQLQRSLKLAVREGTLTSFEAQGVMTAFDAGLVTPNADSLVVESNPAPASTF